MITRISACSELVRKQLCVSDYLYRYAPRESTLLNITRRPNSSTGLCVRIVLQLSFFPFSSVSLGTI
jgi:hypothetical protein